MTTEVKQKAVPQKDAQTWWRRGSWAAGAGTVILGAAVGAVAPVMIMWFGFQHDTDMANRGLEEQAYADTLETTKDLEYRIRIQGQELEDLGREVSSPTLAEAAASIERIRLYGRPEVIEAAGQMLNQLSDAIDKGGESRWDAYDEGRDRYIEEIQDALEVPS